MLTTRFAGPTNHRGSRVIVTHATDKARREIPWDHALDVEENHTNAAKAVAAELGLTGRWLKWPTANGYVFIRDLREAFVIGGQQ